MIESMINAWYRHPRVAYHDYEKRNNLIPSYTEDDYDVDVERRLGWDIQPHAIIFKRSSQKVIDILPYGGQRIIKCGHVHIHDQYPCVAKRLMPNNSRTPVMYRKNNTDNIIFLGKVIEHQD
jgi:hypothetical protein